MIIFSGHVRHDEMPRVGCQKSPESKCECLAYLNLGKHNRCTIAISRILYRYYVDILSHDITSVRNLLNYSFIPSLHSLFCQTINFIL